MSALGGFLADRAHALEAAIGLGLVVAGVWRIAGWGPAAIIAGAVVFTFAVWGRRIT